MCSLILTLHICVWGGSGQYTPQVVCIGVGRSNKSQTLILNTAFSNLENGYLELISKLLESRWRWGVWWVGLGVWGVVVLGGFLHDWCYDVMIPFSIMLEENQDDRSILLAIKLERFTIY